MNAEHLKSIAKSAKDLSEQVSNLLDMLSEEERRFLPTLRAVKANLHVSSTQLEKIAYLVEKSVGGDG